MTPKVIIVVQQETLRERPRIHKLGKILGASNVRFEVWKFGNERNEEFSGIRIRNLISADWRRRPAVLRYALWMIAVFCNALREAGAARFVAVGFDSALPISLASIGKPRMIFDNIDNISLSYRWPTLVRSIFHAMERWVSRRAQLHVIPTRARWKESDSNLRVITNTPSREIFEEAASIARKRNYRPGPELTVYLNGWLSPTRGIGTLLGALQETTKRQVRIRVLVAGRPSCEEARKLLAMDCTEDLGMLTNAEALATYYRSHIAFAYYDPSVDGNRLAASQKWTDCWATHTAFITNQEVETLKEYVRQGACLTLPYHDSAGLASLLESLSRDPAPLEKVRANLQKMEFRFWDEEMKKVIDEWSELNATR